MTELALESVIFARVKPGQIEQTFDQLRRSPKVRLAKPVKGGYDLAISGVFKSTEELRDFLEEVEESESCEGCAAYAGFQEGSHEGKVPETPFVGWTLIHATNPERALKDLQEVGASRTFMAPEEESGYPGPYGIATSAQGPLPPCAHRFIRTEPTEVAIGNVSTYQNTVVCVECRAVLAAFDAKC